MGSLKSLESFKDLSNNKNKLILTSAALLLAGNASAATFDFANIADGVSSDASLVSYAGSSGSGPFTGELGAEFMEFTSGGIGLTVTASGSDNPYLDSNLDPTSGTLPAGLGVCGTLVDNLNGNTCFDPADDNVTPGEELKLTFNQEVTISTTTFRNGEHDILFDPSAEFGLTIDGVPVSPDYNLVNVFSEVLTGTTFVFSNINTPETDGFQFYIETMEVAAVPLPAAAWLFGSAIMGLTVVSRRKNKAAVA